ncbi:MAG: aspartate--tRNA(Asn) ligase [Candidatus Yanofskybacteria bacterium]|nr:aspartate--tRNA(Asn) ligase [Candidatus Yanofskybacteria bacterium]
MRTQISETKNRAGETVQIFGWVHTVRDQGSIKFLIIRDVSGLIQVVVTKKQKKASDIAKTLSLESVVKVVGLAKEEKQAPGGVEVVAEEIEVLSAAEPELPIPVVEKTGETELPKRLDWRWIDLRKPENRLIFQAWTSMERAFVDYCGSNNYIEIHSPKLMSAPSESGGELFEVKYFERKAYLAQSPQFYKQMAMASGFEKTFEIGPVFRANPSFTSRHDTEFTGYDIEISFIESHHDVMAEEERIIVAMLSEINKTSGNEIKKVFGREISVPLIPFPKLTLARAKEILKTLNVPSETENDLSPEEERKLGEYINKKESHEFVFVTDYPKEIRPFYHMRHKENGNLTKSFDLLFMGLEITTGAQREHRYDVLLNQAKEKGLHTEPIQFYLNFFKYGCPPHGGFGFGPSRFVMQALGLNNVREVTYLYRGVKRLEP